MSAIRLLHDAYADASDDENGRGEVVQQPALLRREVRYQRRETFHDRSPMLVAARARDAFVPGRYVSKRERALLSSPTVPNVVDHSSSSALPPSSAVGDMSMLNVRSDILYSLSSQRISCEHRSRTPIKLTVSLSGHTKPVSALHWSTTHPHLLASAGMDQTVRIWNVWSKNYSKPSILRCHNAAVKDVRWSREGCSLLSCGYDCSTWLVDVEKVSPLQCFKENQVVSSIRVHPHNPNVFLSGGARGSLRLWDIRLGKVVQEYVRDLGSILDVEFSADAKHFISSTDTSRSNLSENAIIVWDVCRAVPLSNQVYVEAYTCTCVRYHPLESFFVAQSNGNYIAIFSSRPPFTLDRYKRYEKHNVSAYPIKCNFSLDGTILASGSSDGSIYLYNYRSSELLKKLEAFDDACIDVVFHPIMCNVVACCCWNGDIAIAE